MMKRKHTLYLAILLGLLVSMAAVPVLAADGDIPMWVHRARLVYTGRSSGGPDMMVAYIHIRDADLDMVDGATVGATWTLPDETEEVAIPVTTNVQGIAEFRIFKGAGDYVICVTGVTKTGWVYDASLNTDDACAVYELPPFPAPYPW